MASEKYGPRVAIQDPESNGNNHHQFHPGRKLRQLLLPEGRTVHIVDSPSHAESLKRSHSTTGEDVEIVIHGTEDHIELLRQSQRHHEELRDLLRERHGPAFEEFEAVITQMDAISAELHLVSDQAVQLDANFSKYGYSATIRTHESSPHTSRTPSLKGDGSSMSSADWEAEKRNARAMKFWVKPSVRQYLHKGLLWRNGNTHEVASYELFVDLLYVGLVGIAGDTAAENATGDALNRFAITFIMGWKLWSEITQYQAWFDGEDVSRRLAMLVLMACLLGFTTNVAGFQAADGTYTDLAAFYIAARVFGGIYYFWYAYLIRIIAATLLINGILATIAIVLWIGSIHLGEPHREVLIWAAIFVDILGPVIIVAIKRTAQKSPIFRERLSQWMEFAPAINIEHRVERTGAFVTLVFGYSVLSSLYQNSHEVGANSFLGKAVMGLCIAFTYNTLYFEMDTFNMHTHAIRRHYATALLWIFIHLPLMMSFVLAGAAISRLVLAHDVGTSAATLLPPYNSRSQPEITAGQRWFFCAGLGVSLLCTSVIGLCHTYKTRGFMKQTKYPRLMLRILVSAALMLLGLAKSLNSAELIGVATALLLCVLFAEILGNMLVEHANECRRSNVSIRKTWFKGMFDHETKCKYSARCHVSRKDLEASVLDGKIIKLDEVTGERGFTDH